MPTAEKTATIEELTTRMAEAKAIYLADFTGVDVASVTQLRRDLRAAAVDYRVVKNRLAKRAADAAGMAQMKDHLTGPTAIAFAADDPVAPARIMDAFIGKGGKLAIKTGFLEGRALTPDEVQALAKLPSKEVLLGKVVGAVQSPLYGLAGVLTALLRNLVGVVAAIEKQRQEQGGDAAEAASQ